MYDSIYQQIGITSYQYDQNGQMVSFTYDCHNRLIRTETDSGEVTKYLYDAENNWRYLIKLLEQIRCH